MVNPYPLGQSVYLLEQLSCVPLVSSGSGLDEDLDCSKTVGKLTLQS